MSAISSIDHLQAKHSLEPIDDPYAEPRVLFQNTEQRRNNSHLTLIDGKTFSSAERSGDIFPPGAPDVGFFHQDTRFLSRLELRVSGHKPVVLSVANERNFSAQIELTMGNVTIRDSLDLPANTVHIRRDQLLYDDTLFDVLTFENFNLTPIDVNVEVLYSADFVDIFQVRGCARGKSGQYHRPVVEGDSIVFHYMGLDKIARSTEILHAPAAHATSIENDKVTARWQLHLDPFQRIRIESTVTAISSAGKPNTQRPREFRPLLAQRRADFERWHEQSTHFWTDNDEFNTLLNTCSGDFFALRIPNGKQHVVAAGIPWFATIFGRDSLIASYQTLSLNPTLAADTLRVLARYQGKEVNAWRDEQPGKILHEQRDGEMAHTREIPFGAYYGSVDATPLFLVAASEAFNWTADESLLRDLLPHIYAALDWIDKYGDLDGDGLIEYQRAEKSGLFNQGWKDSGDANMFRDGTVAQPPLALIEVQGYVYDAKYRMAQLLRHVGDQRTSERLRAEASEMMRRIEKAFWLPKQGYFAMALDRDKRPVETVASNPGQLLFSRAVKTDRARAITKRLMQDDMQSGWGWRTLASSEPVFNPLSYHRGSVWPHDNSLIAHGMCLYEMRGAALHTLTTLYEAALNFADMRLPELFCGIQRGESGTPVHYPVSCSPQAWASGAIFFMLASILGIRPSAQRKELNIINPVLPDWLKMLHVRNMRIGESRVDLDFERRGERTYCNVADVRGDKLMVNIGFKKN